ncbi:dsDNA nuclease domain-containing protein [Kaistella sp.]|uniref:dsDNA nuclease domain-containing protein n=1 Tax=Kaistella sp. TaxID=2782235 RepID=UPI002F95EC43
MKLEEQILKLKPREESGSKTARKYMFQNDWSLFLLMRNHEKLDDYVYLFDFHEDLVVLDSPDNPKNINFYQIKSKDSGNWTVGALTKSESGKLSILGKLYLNKLNFPKETRNLYFVSNAKFSIKDLSNKDDSTLKSELKISDFDSKNIKNCQDKLNTEHSPNDCSDFTDYINFKVTKLSNSDSSTHCQGELSNLINTLNPDHKINPTLAYKQIYGEIQKRANTTTSDKSLSTIQDLIEIKGISKTQFLSFLKSAGLYKSVEEEWLEAQSLLKDINISPIELLKYRKSWRDVSMKLISDIDKIPLMDLKKEIENNLEKAINLGTITDKSKINDIWFNCETNLSVTIFDNYFIKCLIIKILYERFQ